MRVQCMLCDAIDEIDSDSLEAKRLVNRPVHTYMCKACSKRIAEKTAARKATGKFKLYQTPTVEDYL